MARLLIRDLTPTTDYFIQVRAVEGDSTSEWSRRFALTTIGDSNGPDAPVIGTFVPDGTSFNLTWTGIDFNQEENMDFAYYEILFTAVVGGGTFTVKTVNTNYILTFEENKARFGTPKGSIKAKVRAVDTSGNVSVYSSELTATNAVPNAPTSVDAEPVADGIKITWVNSSSDDVIGYNIYIGTATAPTTKVAFTNSNPYTYTSLTFVPQFVRLTAVDVFGQESAYSNEDSATPESPFVIDTTPPPAPTGFSAVISNQDTSTVITRQIATLTWTYSSPPTDLAGFHIRFKKTGTSNWTILNANPEALTYQVTLPEPFVGYDFEIRAYDLYTNKSSWVSSNPGAVTTYTPPVFIQDLIIGGGGSIESYNFASGIAGFRIDEDAIIINEGEIRGEVLTAGIIKSNQPALDNLGAPISGEWAWQIDLEGDAVFGDVKVRGSMVVGAGEADGDQFSIVQSGNYMPGTAGWMLRSDGTVEFRNIVDNSLDGASIQTGTLSVAALDAGDLDANINLLSTITAYGEMGEEVNFGVAGFSVLGPDSVLVTNKALSAGSATLTTATAHGFKVGGKILVEIDDTLFDGQYIISSIGTNTVTYTVTDVTTTVGTTTSEGSVKGRDFTGLNNGPKFVDFPTDGTQPNIISGQLTTDKLTITGGATFRGTSGIEKGSSLVIDNDILPPKGAPTLSYNYNDVTINDIPSVFTRAGFIYRNPRAATIGHTGNVFILASAGWSTWSISEHDPDTGELLNIIAQEDYSTTTDVGQEVIGLVFSDTYDRYYLYSSWSGREGEIQKVTVYDTTWTPVADYTIGEDLIGSATTGDYMHNVNYATIGWDYTNDRLMWVGKDFTSDPLRIRYYTMGGTGIPTSIAASATLDSTTTVAQNARFIARGSFDYGADRIVYRDNKYLTSNVVTTYFMTFTTAGVNQPYERWNPGYSRNTLAAYWNPTNSKFYGIDSAKRLLEYQGGDAMWGKTNNITNKALTSNVVTLTTGAAHDLHRGHTVIVAGVGAPFDGTYTVTGVPTTTTFTYAKTNADITSAAATGTAISNWNGKRWVGYTWYDHVGTTHETTLSPHAFTTISKRLIMNVTIAPIPIGLAGADDPKQARVYVSNLDPGGTAYWRLRPTIQWPNQSGKVDPYQTISASVPPATNEFLLISTTPGQIISSTGNSFWKGDDTARFYALELRSGTDVSAVANNKPPLRIGALDGKEMRLDGNEIQVVSSPSSGVASTLYLQQSGGDLNMNGASQIAIGGKTITKWNWGTVSDNPNGSGDITVTHGLGGTPGVVFLSPTAQETINPNYIAHTLTSTTFKVRVKQGSDGTDYTGGGTRTFDWFAIRA